jgi:hypothetical protein
MCRPSLASSVPWLGCLTGADAAASAGSAAACCAAGSTNTKGSTKVQWVPLASLRVSMSCPPSIVARRDASASPSPTPPCSRCALMSPWVKASNKRFCCGGAMPGPVSITSMALVPSRPRWPMGGIIRRTWTLTPPARVNRRALSTTWCKSCCTRVASKRSMRGKYGSIVIDQLRPRARSLGVPVKHGRDRFRHNHIAHVWLEGAALKPRVFKQLVDHAQQGVGAALCVLQVFTLMGGQITVQGEVEHAHHGVQGGAEFVTHGGQKIAFGLVAGFGLLQGDRQGLVQGDAVQ